tara:strand:- start:235 stop:546 length:312 start_codon:yes stop_codon:yes gene_type:complete
MDLDQISWKNNLDADESAIILDVRTAEEFKISHLSNSINIDFYNPQHFMNELGKLDKDLSYYVYCRTGVRSSNSCALMSELGFKKTFNLIGGIVEWNGVIKSQ